MLNSWRINEGQSKPKWSLESLKKTTFVCFSTGAGVIQILFWSYLFLPVNGLWHIHTMTLAPVILYTRETKAWRERAQLPLLNCFMQNKSRAMECLEGKTMLHIQGSPKANSTPPAPEWKLIKAAVGTWGTQVFAEMFHLFADRHAAYYNNWRTLLYCLGTSGLDLMPTVIYGRLPIDWFQGPWSWTSVLGPESMPVFASKDYNAIYWKRQQLICP